MYCPRCGQQAFDEVRFCSRCGFRLDGVTVLLDQDGSIVPPAIQTQPSEVSPRQKGIRLGVKLIFLSIVLFPIFMAIAMTNKVDSPAPLLVPLTAFLLGLTRLLYSVIFESEWSPAKPVPQPRQVRIPKSNAILSPPPASITGFKPVNTADMLQSPSVTENTTNLLEKKG
jgi:hypothetical protein